MFGIKEIDMNKVIFDSDSYKYMHKVQYPFGVTKAVAYGEARGSEIEGIEDVVVFGLQFYLKNLELLTTLSDVEVAKTMLTNHMGNFNYEDWKFIATNLGGKLPIKIRAVEEGTIVKTGEVIFTIENTHPRFFWLPNFIETYLMRVWKPTTIATVSREYKKILKENMLRTCDSLNGLPFMVHDFSSRSGSCGEDSVLGASGHLLNFLGTDTVLSLFALKYVYNEECAGFSVYATEHSTTTSHGRENEKQAYEHIINSCETSICSMVMDSYDVENAIENIMGNELIDLVENGNKTIVFRLDSGDTVEIVSTIFNIMLKKFSWYVNTKGYKVFNKVKILQGDGVNFKTMKAILKNMEEMKISTDCIVFGIGSELCHKFNRDTFKFAIKMCSILHASGQWADVYKDPKNSFKKSKKGLLGLNSEFKTVKFDTYEEFSSDSNFCRVVFDNGVITRNFTLSEIREKING